MRTTESASAIVVAGGDPVPASLVQRLALDGTIVVAADSGLGNARALGLDVDVVVGDLDSVAAGALAEARAAGAAVEAHPVDKDATDLELAVDAAVKRGARRVTVLGGYGGRTDHLLANVALLSSERFAAIDVDAWMGDAHLTVLHGGSRARITGAVGSLCTLLAVHGPATGVTTDGLRFPLQDDVLVPGSTRGVSNELTAPDAGVSVIAGTLVVVQPHALALPGVSENERT